MPNKRIKFDDWSGGLNDNSSKRDLKKNEFTSLNGLSISNKGQLRMFGQLNLSDNVLAYTIPSWFIGSIFASRLGQNQSETIGNTAVNGAIVRGELIRGGGLYRMVNDNTLYSPSEDNEATVSLTHHVLSTNGLYPWCQFEIESLVWVVQSQGTTTGGNAKFTLGIEDGPANISGLAWEVLDLAGGGVNYFDDTSLVLTTGTKTAQNTDKEWYVSPQIATKIPYTNFKLLGGDDFSAFGFLKYSPRQAFDDGDRHEIVMPFYEHNLDSLGYNKLNYLLMRDSFIDRLVVNINAATTSPDITARDIGGSTGQIRLTSGTVGTGINGKNVEGTLSIASLTGSTIKAAPDILYSGFNSLATKTAGGAFVTNGVTAFQGGAAAAAEVWKITLKGKASSGVLLNITINMCDKTKHQGPISGSPFRWAGNANSIAGIIETSIDAMDGISASIAVSNTENAVITVTSASTGTDAGFTVESTITDDINPTFREGFAEEQFYLLELSQVPINDAHSGQQVYGQDMQQDPWFVDIWGESLFHNYPHLSVHQDLNHNYWDGLFVRGIHWKIFSSDRDTSGSWSVIGEDESIWNGTFNGASDVDGYTTTKGMYDWVWYRDQQIAESATADTDQSDVREEIFPEPSFFHSGSELRVSDGNFLLPNYNYVIGYFDRSNLFANYNVSHAENLEADFPHQIIDTVDSTGIATVFSGCNVYQDGILSKWYKYPASKDWRYTFNALGIGGGDDKKINPIFEQKSNNASFGNSQQGVSRYASWGTYWMSIFNYIGADLENDYNENQYPTEFNQGSPIEMIGDWDLGPTVQDVNPSSDNVFSYNTDRAMCKFRIRGSYNSNIGGFGDLSWGVIPPGGLNSVYGGSLTWNDESTWGVDGWKFYLAAVYNDRSESLPDHKFYHNYPTSTLSGGYYVDMENTKDTWYFNHAGVAPPILEISEDGEEIPAPEGGEFCYFSCSIIPVSDHVGEEDQTSANQNWGNGGDVIQCFPDPRIVGLRMYATRGDDNHSVYYAVGMIDFRTGWVPEGSSYKESVYKWTNSYKVPCSGNQQNISEGGGQITSPSTQSTALADTYANGGQCILAKWGPKNPVEGGAPDPNWSFSTGENDDYGWYPQYTTQLLNAAQGLAYNGNIDIPLLHAPSDSGETYESINGFDPTLVETLDVRYKASCVAGQRLFAGNIEVIEGGKRRYYNDRMVFSPVGKYDIFAYPTCVLDLNISDGDEIMGLASIGTRIIQFKRGVAYIIDISSGLPETFIVEDRFKYKGINNRNHFCDTDKGVFWFNEVGAYLYEEEEGMQELFLSDDDDDGGSMSRINPNTWADFVNSIQALSDSNSEGVSGCFYNPSSKEIIVTARDSQRNNKADGLCYVYNMVQKAWTRHEIGLHLGHDAGLYDLTNYINAGDKGNAAVIVGKKELEGVFNDIDPDTRVLRLFSSIRNTTNSLFETYLTFDDMAGFETKVFDLGSPSVKKKIISVTLNVLTATDNWNWAVLVLVRNSVVDEYITLTSFVGGLGETDSGTSNSFTVGLGQLQNDFIGTSVQFKVLVGLYHYAELNPTGMDFAIDDLSFTFREGRESLSGTDIDEE